MGCGKIVREVLAADIAVVNGLHRTALVILDTTALANPFEARTCEPPLDVDRHGGGRIGGRGLLGRGAGRRGGHSGLHLLEALRSRPGSLVTRPYRARSTKHRR